MNRGTSSAQRLPDLEIHPDPSSDRLLVTDGKSGRQFRLTPEAADVLNLLDGSRNSEQVAREIAGTSNAEEIGQAIDRLVDLGLARTHDEARPTDRRRWFAVPLNCVRRVETSLQRYQRPGRRLRYNPPAGIEFSFGNPERVLASVAPLFHGLSTKSGRVFVTLFTALGISALAVRWARIIGDISRPVQWWVVVAAFLISLLTAGMHELAHGIALHRRGGRARRLGFMILYGSPALFCDVSQAWRLPRADRVRVALAGVKLHLFAAATAGVVLLGLGGVDSGYAQLTSLIALADLTMAGINLIPFVKFDGYIALVGWTDIPHLRQKSMALAGDRVGRLVLGGGRPTTRRSQVSGAGWMLFGATSAVVAPALVLLALLQYGPAVAQLFGPAGAGAVLIAVAALLYLSVRNAIRAAARARGRNVPAWRRWVGILAASACVAIPLLAVRIPMHVTSPFQVKSGAVYLIADRGDIPPPGRRVDLRRAGIVLHPRQATGYICGPVERVELASDAGSPVISSTSAREVVRSAVPVCLVDAAPASGIATVEMGKASLGEWLRETFVSPYLSTLGF